jgi:hypothetical protein
LRGNGSHLPCSTAPFLSWRFPRNFHVLSRLRNRSRRYVTTDGQSVRLSWCQACCWAQDQILLLLAVILGSESRWTPDHILLSQIRDSHDLEGQQTTLRIRVRVRVTIRLAVYRQSVCLGAKPLKNRDQHLFQLNTCSNNPYIAYSVTRGWVCRSQFLLVLTSAVTLRSESRGTHDHNLQSQIRDSRNLDGQVPVFISPRNRMARLYAEALGSPFRRLLRLAGLRWRYSNPLLHGLLTKNSNSKLLYDWRFTANYFVLASSSLRPTT